MQTDADLIAASFATNPNDIGTQAAFTDAVTEAAQEANLPTAGFCGYCPEMGDARPVAHIHATLSHYGRHYFLRTPLVLKGRGIESMGVLTATRLVPGSKFVGWNEYQVTIRAFDKLKTQYRIASEMLL